ncbi:MAG: hypothetical protein KAH08_02055 [Methylococcales bacterium]|nr:hypothetical protein [Methylococcales bacterium]
MTNCLADADFSLENSQLKIPFVRYQGQTYKANLTFLPPNKLRLNSAVPQADIIPTAGLVPVYNDLSFHLSAINVGDKEYSLDATHLGNSVFELTNVSEVPLVTIGRALFNKQYFSGSGVCAQCHNALEDDKGEDVSIEAAWKTTMMANASKDPFWQAKVKSELNRTPQLTAVIQDKCTRCHAPMANETARKNNDAVQAVFGSGILNPDNPYYDLASEGVSCSLCHQISPNAPFGTIAGYSGNFVIDETKNKTDRPIYGPYKDVRTQPMRNFASFTPTYSEHIKSSELCASCHDLTTPYTDENGVILSKTVEDEFPEQMPYSEWQHSEFSTKKSCQQCHMERSNGVILATQPGNTKKRDDFAKHSFLGANRLMLSILQEYREPLGVRATDFSSSILKAEQLLNSAAYLEIKQTTLKEGTLNFNLRINSETGHKLPSGYPSRRVILHLTVRDQTDKIVFETGKVNADGSVVELDSDQALDKFEPHYQTITSPKQVQVYEAIMHDYKDTITYTLLRAKGYIKDNRILPKGFDKATVPNKIKVKGAAATDENFVGGHDIISFELANLNETTYTIKAELIYQTIAYAFAQDLFKETSPVVTRFKQMFDSSALKSTSMGTITQKVKAR